MSEEELELFEERAAIIEFDAHKTRRYAESLALAWIFDVYRKALIP